MSDFWFLLVVLVAAVNPAAVAIGARRMELGARADGGVVVCVALAIGIGLVVLLASTSEAILDFLDVAPETFRIAAGIVMFAAGAGAQLRGHIPAVRPEGNRLDAVFPLAIPLLVSPATIVAAMSYGVDRGEGVTIAAAVIALAAAAGLAWRMRPGWAAAADGMAKVLTVVLVVAAVGLVVEGVRDV